MTTGIINSEPVVLFAVGKPKAQPRPKVNTATRSARTPDPSGEVASWKARVQAALLGAPPVDRHRLREWAEADLAMEISMQIRLDRPKSSRLPHASVKPDWDNLAKLIQDELERSGGLRNDSRIVRATVLKRWTKQGEKAGATIVLVPYTEER